MHAKKIDLMGKLYLRGKITFALAYFTLNNHFLTIEGGTLLIYLRKQGVGGAQLNLATRTFAALVTTYTFTV